MKIHTTAILGAGAVGSYFLWGLSEKLGDNLWVIADGERRERMESEGICINGQIYHPNIRTPKEAYGADLILTAVKYGGLSSAVDAIAEMTADHTLVLSVLNGVDSEEIIGAKIGSEHVIPALIKIASRRVGNEIRFDPATTFGILYGEAEKDAASERTDAIAELFDGTPLHYRVCADILQEIWYKFAFNVSMNLPQAILNCSIGAYVDSEHAAWLRIQLRDEVAAVAAAKGIDISELSELEKLKHPSPPGARYSTLQDLDAGRHTEIEMFAGTVVRMGRELGVATPYNAFAYHAVKALEEKNDGKFNYDE